MREEGGRFLFHGRNAQAACRLPDMRLTGDIDLAIQRVRRAEIIVLRQKRTLLAMARRGDPTEMAEDLLDTYERILRDYRAHLALLLGEPPGSF